MDRGEVVMALGRAVGRFSEAWGGDLDPTDSTDLEALGYLLHQELESIVEREAIDPERLAELREKIRKFGEGSL